MNRVLKIVVGSFLLFWVCFFALGLVFPKVNYEAEIAINKPVEETFTLFNDLDKMQNWIPDVKSWKYIEETPDKVGTRISMVVKNEGKEMELIETITAFEENKLVALEFDAGSMIKKDRFKFSSVGDKTVIKASYECEGANIFHRSLFSLFKSYFREIDEGYLARFKEFSES